MAYATDFRATTHGSIGDRLRAVMETLRRVRAQRRVYRQTLTELNSLSRRELNDLGIGTCDIPVIARAAADLVK